ncbi:MAG: rhomboid family intramembrane serine protease [Candidatus Pacearchaeota archaeon]
MRNKYFFISVTNLIIIINILFFFIFNIFFIVQLDLTKYLALNPLFILKGKYLWTIITHFFMHANSFHLFANMISLFFIGNFVEKIIGRKRFFRFYILSGIFAALFFVLFSFLFNKDINSYAVGASGALFALGGLLMILLPKIKVYVFFFLPMPLWLGMLFMLLALWAVSISLGLTIANTAHLGGLIIGLLYGFYLKRKYRNKVNLLRKIFR